MFKFNYLANSKQFNVSITVEYKLSLPKVFLDFIEAANKEKESVEDYLVGKNVTRDSDINKVVRRIFRDEINYFEVYSDNYNEVLENGYLLKTEVIEYEVDSFAPFINLYDVRWKNGFFKVEDLSKLEEAAIKSIKKSIPNAFDFKLSDREDGSVSFIEKEMELSAEGTKVLYEGYEVSGDISWDVVSELNNIRLSDGRYNYPEFDTLESFAPISNDKEITGVLSQIGTSVLKVELEKLYMRVTQYGIWNGLLVSDEFSLKEIQFMDPDYKWIYDVTLDQVINNDLTPPLWMSKAFIKREPRFIKYLTSNEGLLNALIIDKEMLTRLLLSEEEFVIPEQTNKDMLITILNKASHAQLPIMLNKISADIKDTFDDIKFINRLFNANPELLTMKQRQIKEDDEKQKAAMLDEYHKLVGKIASLGVRESIKSLNKQELKKLEVNGKYKKWLNKTLGHNKGNDIITPNIVDAARKYMLKSEKIAKYFKDKNKK